MYITRCTPYVPGVVITSRGAFPCTAAPNLGGLLLPEGSRTLTGRVKHCLFRDEFLQAARSALIDFFTSTNFHMYCTFHLGDTHCVHFCFTAYLRCGHPFINLRCIGGGVVRAANTFHDMLS